MSLSIPHFTPQLLLARLSAHSALTHVAALAKFMAPPASSKGKATQPAPPSGSAAQPAGKGKATQPAPPSGSAAQPAVLPLHELNKRSAQFGAWTVVVRQARVEEYEYQWEGQKRSGKTFCCLFVSAQDPTEYCMGQMRFVKKTESIFNAIQKSFVMVTPSP